MPRIRVRRVLRAHFAAKRHLQRSIDQLRLAEGCRERKDSVSLPAGFGRFKLAVKLFILRAAGMGDDQPTPEPSCGRRRRRRFHSERIARAPAPGTRCLPPRAESADQSAAQLAFAVPTLLPPATSQAAPAPGAHGAKPLFKYAHCGIIENAVQVVHRTDHRGPDVMSVSSRSRSTRSR